MESINGRLTKKNNNSYFINHTRKFSGEENLAETDVKQCFDFAYKMAFEEGEHRSNRSGGDIHRTNVEIFCNAFQGKLAEFAMYRFLLRHNLETTKPDLSVTGYGAWDSFDLEVAGRYVAVKSTKFYGQLLLLETKDWNEDGEYIPNKESGVCSYDLFVLVRISPSIDSEMKKRCLLYRKLVEKKTMSEFIETITWGYDIAGYITKGDLINAIKANYVLPKGALLNGNEKNKMDAENYYVQAGDMRTSKNMINRLLYYKQQMKQE